MKNNDFIPPGHRRHYAPGTTTNTSNTSSSSTTNNHVTNSVTNVVNVNVTNSLPIPTNYIYGTNRNDVLTGTQYNDYIYGKGRNDVLTGNAGSDCLYGGKGRNTYYAQDGEQDFIFITRDARTKLDHKRADVIKSADAIDRINILDVPASKVKVREVTLPSGHTEIGIFAKGRLEALYTGGDLTLHQVEAMII